ncbi:Alpha/Beta hydrolase protein [Ephemerocybe angulata]|uniref:Alpha/Beta hydrolase protein n=1 Tax=Ephemerocybe angulata TaxID=980116 RepID=A0A8H6I678_9AGAR|nr:Alpha/Beta hydrolase protein [Tulosesus angulatus]
MDILVNTTIATTERFVTSTDGTQIFAKAVGDPRLPSIVFVHGFALSALVWTSILHEKKLLKYFQMIAYDLRGFARSDKPRTASDYSSQLVADDFIAVANAFNATKPLFVGWSLGGSYASDILQHYGTAALSGIVCTASLPYSSDAISNPDTQSATLPGFVDLSNSTLALSSRIEFTRTLFNEPDRVPTEVLWSWMGSTIFVDPAVVPLVGGGRGAQNTSNLEEAARKGLPLFVLIGEADKLAVNSEIRSAVEGKWKDLTIHDIKNGSHAMFYEKQGEYVDQLLKFAKRLFKI